jgi:hypothetical protein
MNAAAAFVTYDPSDMRLLICAMAFWICGAGIPSAAWACGCAERSFRERVTSDFTGAERVFVGRVTLQNNLVATFDVDAVWKRDDARQVTVHQGEAMENGLIKVSTCDYSFHVGVRYVVFAYRTKGRLQVSNCGATVEWTEGTRVAALLDSPTPRRNLRRY